MIEQEIDRFYAQLGMHGKKPVAVQSLHAHVPDWNPAIDEQLSIP